MSMHHPNLVICPTDCIIPPKHGRNPSIHDFIFKSKFCVRMAGSSMTSHSFGDRSCQDAFTVRLHLGDQLAQKVKSDGSTCEDDMSCSASSFLSTIAQLCENETEPLCRSDTSTVTTFSTKMNSRSSSSWKPQEVSGFQRIHQHQLDSVPASTFDSLNHRLHSIQLDEDDHAAGLAIQ